MLDNVLPIPKQHVEISDKDLRIIKHFKKCNSVTKRKHGKEKFRQLYLCDNEQLRWSKSFYSSFIQFSKQYLERKFWFK